MNASKYGASSTAGPSHAFNGTDATSPLKRRHHKRIQTMPFEHTTRKKPRRWPLAFRFIKGAIHSRILVPVVAHALFSSLVVFLDQYLHLHLGLPPSIIPSLSIVVGLMLVFRNQTSYSRFWDGRNHLTTIITAVRNLTRTFAVCSYNSDTEVSKESRQTERADTERAIKCLLAILFTTKNHLRSDWGAFSDQSNQDLPILATEIDDDFRELVPQGFIGYEQRGFGVTLELAALLEGYIKRGFDRNWWHAPQASQLSVQVNNIVDAYGKMETIRLTPVPVAHLIHQKQVLALFGAVLPFAMVTPMGWLAIPITILVVFTLYGIDAIATELEDPFGFDRNDIRMGAIVEDIRAEVLVMVDEWRKVGEKEGKDGRGEEGGDWFTDHGGPRVRFED